MNPRAKSTKIGDRSHFARPRAAVQIMGPTVVAVTIAMQMPRRWRALWAASRMAEAGGACVRRTTIKILRWTSRTATRAWSSSAAQAAPKRP